jgi:hypothetical protein
MSNRRLHILPIDADAQLFSQTDVQRNQATQAPVANGPRSVRSVSLDPDERLLEGVYKGRYAKRTGEAFEQLAGNDALGEVAFHDIDAANAQPKDGYYTLSNATVTNPSDDADYFSQFRAVLTRAGSRRTHWRAVETNSVSVSSTFGSDSSERVGVPASASAVRWYDEATATTEDATQQSTETTPSGDVALYDPTEPSFDDPTLIHSLDYSDDSVADPLVFDDRGNTDRSDADGIPQWAHVFSTSYGPEGRWVISNGLLRVFIDETTTGLDAERYDSTNNAWISQSLNSTTWTPVDVDLRRVGQARVVAETLWEDSGSYETVTMAIHRGEDGARFPEGSLPSGLETHLDTIALGKTRDPQPAVSLVERSDVA